MISFSNHPHQNQIYLFETTMRYKMRDFGYNIKVEYDGWSVMEKRWNMFIFHAQSLVIKYGSHINESRIYVTLILMPDAQLA